MVSPQLTTKHVRRSTLLSTQRSHCVLSHVSLSFVYSCPTSYVCRPCGWKMYSHHLSLTFPGTWGRQECSTLRVATVFLSDLSFVFYNFPVRMLFSLTWEDRPVAFPLTSSCFARVFPDATVSWMVPFAAQTFHLWLNLNCVAYISIFFYLEFILKNEILLIYFSLVSLPCPVSLDDPFSVSCMGLQNSTSSMGHSISLLTAQSPCPLEIILISSQATCPSKLWIVLAFVLPDEFQKV